MYRSRVLTCLVLAGTGAAIPVVLAFSSGADSGYSGGPAGYQFGAGNCVNCHTFHMGSGRVELLGAPRRYRAGVLYDLTVRITDPQQAGAGFEISAEGAAGHIGTLLLADDQMICPNGCTKYASAFNTDYVTHTSDGYNDSVSHWAANFGSYEYQLAWEAPPVDRGTLAFFVAGNAADNAQAYQGDHYYATYLTASYANPGDADGDTDVDLRDFALLQQCFGAAVPDPLADCGFVDADSDNVVSLADLSSFVALLEADGPTAPLPAGYVLADPVRGGLLYDKWWMVNGAAEPTQDHPLWAFRPDLKSNPRTGSATWRCKECHGWDYKGANGAYGSGNHHTGFGGIIGTTLGPQEVFDLLTGDSPEAGGHNMDAAGMSERDLWDVVRMAFEGVIQTDDYIDGNGEFIGDAVAGSSTYFMDGLCGSCHGPDGTDINFGTETDPEYVGTVAAQNPWEFLHKVRFGHPASAMPALDLLGWSLQEAADVGAFCAGLPTQ